MGTRDCGGDLDLGILKIILVSLWERTLMDRDMLFVACCIFLSPM